MIWDHWYNPFLYSIELSKEIKNANVDSCHGGFFPSSLFCLCLSLPCIPRCLWPTGAADRSKTDGWGTSFNHCCDTFCPLRRFRPHNHHQLKIYIILIISISWDNFFNHYCHMFCLPVQISSSKQGLVPQPCFARLFVPPPLCCATTF